MIRNVCALALLSFALPVRAQVKSESTTFVVGHAVGGRHNDICLTLPPPLIDWRAAAISALGETFVNKPNLDTLRAHYIEEFGIGASFPFSVTAPSLLTQTNWLILHTGGMTDVHPTMLRGHARWALTDDRATIKGSEFSGLACAPIATSIDAAFFIQGDRAANWTTALGPQARLIGQVANDRTKHVFEIVIAAKRYSFTEEDYLKTVKQTRVFRRAGRTLLLITFPMDDCSDFYSLYEVVAGRLRSVSKHTLGCED